MQTAYVDKYIAAVREQATGSAEAAYVHRIELQRAVLKLHRVVATVSGAKRPETLDARLEEDGGIRTASNRMAAIATQICQPSEALDRRWANEWQALRAAVESLEVHIARTKDPAPLI
ncbi:hypothetical protein [Mycobacterium marseillense]|uniref:Uncharacterized protein n=1 Tax=Mycobacterium marseillense TaxID=701042 RepID=A0ABM7JJJ7_9MYCO|nr:hypothetical protein [Mycobacterium marseillense]MCV7406935.1 hypothetical protein [Mycobacterium marseillense]BBY13830.1 hypothetical protein MMARJ_45700 [Mycobacterium marseillense]